MIIERERASEDCLTVTVVERGVFPAISLFLISTSSNIKGVNTLKPEDMPSALVWGPPARCQEFCCRQWGTCEQSDAEDGPSRDLPDGPTGSRTPLAQLA